MKTHELLSQIVKPRRPWWWRWLKRIGKSLLVCAIILACRQWWQHHQATKKLEETLAELDRAEPGWRLEDIEAARKQVPEDENSARVVATAAKLLPKQWPAQEIVNLFTDLSPVEQLAPENFARLEKELEDVRVALKAARRLAQMPRGRHRLIYKRNPLDTLLPDQPETRRVVTLLGYDALRHDQRRDMKAALTSCRAELNAARSIGDEPFAITQNIRVTGVIAACQSIERTLAQGEPSLDEMAVMQKCLHAEDGFPDQLVVARGERGMLHGLFDALESGDVPFTKLEGMRPSWKDQISSSFAREKLREAHPTMLALMGRWLSIAQLPMYEQEALEQQLDTELRAMKTIDPLTVLLISTLTKVAGASRRKHACIRCITIALAAERSRVKRGAWPDKIDDLCPEYLPVVPLDPFDGQPMRYRHIEDGVMIYSVGNDATDNGGNLDPEHPNQPGVDIGYRLWDMAKRRQAPRSKPAAPPAPAPIPKPG